ncbi:hypothetical protein [Ekhidna sp.]|uniref:hypothetical protein n=1 Tax=Ekhidna sp. TaxID=2608089 RepID=UPI0035141C18
MNSYKFIKQKTFEKLESFEKRMQEYIGQGWKVHSFTSDHRTIIVMLERER